MTLKISDPKTFLTNLVIRKGRSDLFGVYLTGVNVIADSQEDYEYDVSLAQIEKDLESLFVHDAKDWNKILVETRRNKDELIHPISFIRNGEPNTVYFVVEDHEMSAMVFIPTLLVDDFVVEVTFFQHLLREVARFAGKTNTSIRFTLGCVSMEWGDLVEQGHAQEVDVGF